MLELCIACTKEFIHVPPYMVHWWLVLLAMVDYTESTVVFAQIIFFPHLLWMHRLVCLNAPKWNKTCLNASRRSLLQQCNNDFQPIFAQGQVHHLKLAILWIFKFLVSVGSYHTVRQIDWIQWKLMYANHEFYSLHSVLVKSRVCN